MKIISNFKDRLKEAMGLRGVKQQTLANNTGISKSCISLYVNGAVEPSQSNFKKIADYLNIDYAWLMGYDTEMDREEPEHLKTRLEIEVKLTKINYEHLKKVNSYVDLLIKEESYGNL